MTTDTDLIYGEQPADLLPPLRAIAASAEEMPDGMIQYDARFEMAAGAPLFRALMRAEAELLREDADNFGVPGVEDRTPDQRRADAFLLICSALAAA